MTKLSTPLMLFSDATSRIPILEFWASNSAVSEFEAAGDMIEDPRLAFWASNSAVRELEIVDDKSGDLNAVDEWVVNMDEKVVGIGPGIFDLLHGSVVIQGSACSVAEY